jgi:pimeloyl-ACP methyl ester carboxylesterase
MTLRFALVAALAFQVLPAHAASVDDVDVHWSSHGAGPALILVHGWTADESAWSEQVTVLSRNYRVITLDLPGHGHSGMPAAFSITLFARAVEAVRAECGANRVVLGGHDLGAMVIRRYALMYPNRVSGLVIVDGHIPIPDGQSGPPADVLTVDSAKREWMIRDGFGKSTPPELQERILKMQLAPPDTTASETLVALHDRSQWTNERVTLPVLAIYSGLGMLATASDVKKLFPTAQYHFIPGTGHFVMMEAPAPVNRLIEGFLADIAF